MRRSEGNLYLGIVCCIGFGLAGLYFGYFGSGTICDSTCRTHTPGTLEPLPTFVGALFLGIGLYLLYRILRRRKPDLLASSIAGGEGAGEQARLAQKMRAFYTNPAHPVGSLSNPTDFDRLMLSLFDSIEAGSSDIDDKIEGLRSYLRLKGFWGAYRERFKASLVWRKGAASLQWTKQSDEIWQLRCNWNRLLRVANAGPWWKDGHPVASSWIAPARASVITAR
jgi:hypothetical protein